MKRRDFLKTVGIALAAQMLARAETAKRSSVAKASAFAKATVDKMEDRPNVVIIFADDLGYSDIGCFGGEIETPNLDRLAENGVRFSQFYNAARCCPARASLLTGLYPHQAGVGLMVYRNYGDGYRGNLNDHCVTFGEVLGSAGYQTMMVGKWQEGEVGEKIIEGLEELFK